MGSKTFKTAIELVSRKLMLQIKFFVPRFTSHLYKSDLFNSVLKNTINEASWKLYHLQEIVKAYPFKDSINAFPLNVGSYCPSTIVELFKNLSH